MKRKSLTEFYEDDVKSFLWLMVFGIVFGFGFIFGGIKSLFSSHKAEPVSPCNGCSYPLSFCDNGCVVPYPTRKKDLRR